MSGNIGNRAVGKALFHLNKPGEFHAYRIRRTDPAFSRQLLAINFKWMLTGFFKS
jgi:hypothetical protein